MSSALRARLRDLDGAVEAVETGDNLVRLVAETLGEISPRAVATSGTYRGRPVRAVASHASVREGGPFAFDRFAQFFDRVGLSYDRYHVAAGERNTWVHLFESGKYTPESFRQSSMYLQVSGPVGIFEHGRIIACVGGRPIGAAALTLADGAPTFTADELRCIRLATPAMVRALRAASHATDLDTTRSALDHLMRSRADAAFVLSADGVVIAASAMGDRLLGKHPELGNRIGRIVRENRHGIDAAPIPGGWALHVSPCAERGAAPAYLAVAAPASRAEVFRERTTERQAELLEHLAVGCTNAEIAAAMGVAETTVKTWLQRLYRRAGVKNRVALLRWATTEQ